MLPSILSKISKDKKKADIQQIPNFLASSILQLCIINKIYIKRIEIVRNSLNSIYLRKS